jgi:hypothetical protein
MPHRLTAIERATLLEFNKKGAGGDFDQQALSRLSRLFALGMIELRTMDRRLVISSEGRRVCGILNAGWPTGPKSTMMPPRVNGAAPTPDAPDAPSESNIRCHLAHS